MPKISKRFLAISAKVEDRSYSPLEAIELVQTNANAKFDETLEAHVRLGIDPKYTDQQLRTTVALPHGTGQAIRIAVIARGEAVAAAKAAGVARFVFVSSLSAREPDLSAYGKSKADAEALVRESGFDWTMVRPPGVYGPGDKDYLELFKAAKFGVVPVPPEGRSSLIHVEDLARLLVALAPVNPVTRGQTYEPWDDNPFGYEHRELAKMIGAALGKDTIIAAPLPPAVMQLGAQIHRLLRGSKAKLTPDRVGYMLHPDWVCDMKKAPPISLWRAVWGGEDGMKMTADWYREEGWL